MSNQNQQTQQALERSEKLLRQFIEHAPAAIAMLDRGMKYIMTSRRFLTDYNLQQQDLLGRSHYEVFPEIPERWREIHRRCLSGARESAREEPFPRADGRLDWVRWEIQPWYDMNGEIGGIILFSEVITEQKLAQDAIRKSEQRLRNLIDGLGPYMFVGLLGPDGTVLEANQPALKAAGLNLGDVLGKPIEDTFWFSYSQAVRQKMRTAVVRAAKGQFSRFDVGLRTAENQFLILDFSIQPLQDDSGQIKFLVPSAIVITERKLAEKALLASETRFRATFDQAAVGIAHVAPEGLFLRVNQKLCEILGYTREELLGKTFHDITHPADLEAYIANVRQMLAGEIQNYSMEKRYFRKDGSSVWINLTVSIISKPTGEPDYFISVVEDITERKRIAEERKKLEEQLRQAQKMEAVGRLAGGVAHDYNNMLSVIIGYAELAMDKVNPDAPLHDDLKAIINAGTRSAEITRQLLAFARKQTISPNALDLNQAVEAMFKMLQRLIGEDIDLVWLPHSGVCPVKIDPVQLDQILANLCVNARDAIAGVGKVTIETDTVTFDKAYCVEHAGFIPGEFVLLAVSDDGCGMEEETLHNIFEPFFTTKDVNQGTGLGLATVYGIVKQNGGFIDVYSEPGNGTTFKIYLPRHPGEAQKILAKSAAEFHLSRGETIMLVEDERSLLELGKRMLDGLGYTVLAAGTPTEAMALAREHSGGIQLLITDVILPEMTGRDLAKQLHTLFPDIKVLFMSGYTANVITHRGVLEDGVNFIQKPFSRKDLAAKVCAVLDEE